MDGLNQVSSGGNHNMGYGSSEWSWTSKNGSSLFDGSHTCHSHFNDQRSHREMISSLYEEYPREHQLVKLDRQKAILSKAFPGLGRQDKEINYGPVLQDAEGQYAFPRWQAVAPTYEEALKTLLQAINFSRGGMFYSYLADHYGSNWLRLVQRTMDFQERLAKEQDGNEILVVSAQLGLRHLGKPATLPHGTLLDNEYCLDPFSVGSILLTHPGRFVRNTNPWIACSGAQVNDLDFGDHFSSTPVWGFASSQLLFGCHRSAKEEPNCGAATAFLAP